MATVTFFFADQAGSTVQLERLGDAGAKEVRQAYTAPVDPYRGVQGLPT